MSFLIDTNILSELRKQQRADRGVRDWFERADDDLLFVSVLVLGELRSGVELKRRRDPASARSLERWLDGLIERYAARILPIDQRVADQWGRLGHPSPLPAVDGLLAATALVHGLTVVTRNAADFARSGALVLNPFSES